MDPTVGVLDPTTPSVGGGGARDAELPRGTRVGRYTIERLIGRGGMGYVYAARDTQLDRNVALKMLHSAHAASAAELLVHEAKALAKLDDPHVVQVFDAGELDGHVFIAMQLVDGEDLAKTLARRRASLAQLLAWFVDAGRGLAAAHAAGLVHRDFKPGNVLIDRKGRVAVTDFGLAHEIANDGRRTGLGALAGTPSYMAPEQHQQQPASTASDQFAFCVSVWEALFGKHPFIDGDRGSMSPFEISYRIYDGVLIAPPRGTRASRRIIDALSRGLAHEPTNRWPSMTELLAELAPAQQRGRVWPYVAAATVVAGGIGGVSVVLWHGAAASAPCSVVETERAAAVWSPRTGQLIHDRFVQTGRTYAEGASRTAGAAIDAYTKQWVGLSADVCAAERASPGTPPELVLRRRACLDSRLETLHGVVGALSGAITPDVVDHADKITRALGDLDECNGNPPERPPPDKAAEIAKLEVELGNGTLSAIAGDFPHADQVFRAATARADALGWPPLRLHAHLGYGRLLLEKLEPADAELLAAAEIALTQAYDHAAARTLGLAIEAAGTQGKVDAVAALSPLARAAAEHTHDSKIEVAVEISIAVGLERTHQREAGVKACDQGLADAQKLGDVASIANARDCLIEVLSGLGMFARMEPIVQQRIADTTKEIGPDAPAVADYLDLIADIDLRQGKVADARAAAERGLAIRRKLYTPGQFQTAMGLSRLAEVDEAEDKSSEAKQLREQALAILDEGKALDVWLAAKLHISLAMSAANHGKDHFPEAIEHFDKAVAMLRKRYGNDSLEVGIALFNYGQIRAESNLEAGLGMLGESRDILERHHDKRAKSLNTAMMIVAYTHEKFADVVAYGELALAGLDADNPKQEVVMIKFDLARALVETHGDRARARQLAREASDMSRTMGPAGLDKAKTVDAWLAKH